MAEPTFHLSKKHVKQKYRKYITSWDDNWLYENANKIDIIESAYICKEILTEYSFQYLFDNLIKESKKPDSTTQQEVANLCVIGAVCKDVLRRKITKTKYKRAKR